MWQFAPVCDDADRWLGGWPSRPDRSARIAALVGGCRLDAERADELADMMTEVIAGCARSSFAPPVGLPVWLRVGLDAPPKRMSRESPTELLSVPFIIARVRVTAVH